MSEKLLTSTLSSGGAFRFGKEADGEISRWIAAAEADRDAIGSAHGVKVGDRCWVEATNVFYVCTAVTGELTSTWVAATATPGCPPALAYGLYVIDATGANTFVEDAIITIVTPPTDYDIFGDCLDANTTVVLQAITGARPTLNTVTFIDGAGAIPDRLRLNITGPSNGYGVALVQNANGCCAQYLYRPTPA